MINEFKNISETNLINFFQIIFLIIYLSTKFHFLNYSTTSFEYFSSYFDFFSKYKNSNSTPYLKNLACITPLFTLSFIKTNLILPCSTPQQILTQPSNLFSQLLIISILPFQNHY